MQTPNPNGLSTPTGSRPRRAARALQVGLGAATAFAGVALTGLIGASPALATSSSLITQYAGTGSYGSLIQGPALGSSLVMDFDEGTGKVAVDSSGNIYIGDTGHYDVEKVTPAGQLSVFAGVGSYGAPTSGTATSSHLGYPEGIAVDSNGNVYIADTGNSEVEKVTPAGQLSVFAGMGGYGVLTAGTATSTHLDDPEGVAVDSSGDVYIADTNNDDVEKVTPAGQLSIIAGESSYGEPTAGTATSSHLEDPQGVAVDSSGNVYIADTNNDDVEKVTPAGQLSIIAGESSYGEPTAGTATSSHLEDPQGVAVDSSGNVYIADSNNDDVEEVTPAGQLSIIAGQGSNGAPTFGGAASASHLTYPGGVAVDSSGVLYVADTGNETIDRIGPAAPAAPTISSTSPGATSAMLTFTVPVSAGTSQIIGYQISADNGTTWQSATTTSGGGTSLQTTLAGLSPGSVYTVLLRAQNSSGYGTNSSADVVSIAPTPTTTTSTTSAATAATASTTVTTATTSVATTTATASATSELASDSSFDAMHKPYVNTTTGAISVFSVTHDPGTLTWKALYRHPDWLTYGSGSRVIGTAGVASFVISPSEGAASLLRAERHRHGAGVRVAIVVSFQSAYGGPSVTHIMTVLATLHVHG